MDLKTLFKPIITIVIVGLAGALAFTDKITGEQCMTFLVGIAMGLGVAYSDRVKSGVRMFLMGCLPLIFFSIGGCASIPTPVKDIAKQAACMAGVKACYQLKGVDREACLLAIKVAEEKLGKVLKGKGVDIKGCSKTD